MFAMPTWERFAALLPEALETASVGDEDPPGAMEEAMRGILGAR
jgi:hypothetical protein